MDRERTGAIRGICSSNGERRAVTAIINPVHSVIYIYPVETGIRRIWNQRDDSREPRGKVANTDEVIVLIKNKVSYPAGVGVSVKIGVFVMGGKIISLIPHSTNRTVAAELRAR